MPFSRRNFLMQGITIISGLLISACSRKRENVADDNLPVAIADSILDEEFDKKFKIDQPSSLIFIGDSITDASRNRSIPEPNSAEGLGLGFVKIISQSLLAQDQFKTTYIYNRGVAGDSLRQMSDRWESDCIALRPDIVSILIGVNDLRRNVSNADFLHVYDKILTNLKDRLPQVKVIICEPFILPNNPEFTRIQTRFKEYRKIVRYLSKKHTTVFVSFQTMFEDASISLPYPSLTIDGVHPTLKGNQLMAAHWGEFLVK